MSADEETAHHVRAHDVNHGVSCWAQLLGEQTSPSPANTCFLPR